MKSEGGVMLRNYPFKGWFMQKTSTGADLGGGRKCLILLVGASGFEPETSCAQGSKRGFCELAYFQLLTVQWFAAEADEACSNLLNFEDPASYKIIYSSLG